MLASNFTVVLIGISRLLCNRRASVRTSKGSVMPEKNEAQLRQRLEQATTLSEYRRIQCVYLREKYGYSSNQIAGITTYHPASVRRIQSKYRKNGIAALSPKPKGGRNHQNLSLADEQAVKSLRFHRFIALTKKKSENPWENRRFTRFCTDISGEKWFRDPNTRNTMS